MESQNSKEIKIELLNGTGSEDVLEKVKKELTKQGYSVTKIGETSITSNSIIINRTMQSTRVEEDLKEILNIQKVNKSSNNSKVDFTIIIGKDYE